MKTIGITGGTGFIGRHLTKLLTDRGDKVVIFTRHPVNKKETYRVSYAYWDPDKSRCDIDALSTVNAMVHLAGAGIADKRWTIERKKEIVTSRTKGTRFLVGQLKIHGRACNTLVTASATGYYGPDRPGLIPYKEDAPSYNDFLSKTCVRWEDESKKAADLLRTVTLRFGVVLGKEGGAFPQFARPIDFGVMPVLGSGSQAVSWIHVSDLCKMILYAIDQSHVKGIYNAVAPEPVTNKKLMRTIAGVKGGIKIPVPVPAFALKLLLGEMSEEVLKSCTVAADKIQQAGFVFQYPNIKEAVKAILK